MFHTVVDQALASSEGGKRLRALLTLDAYDVLAGAPDSTQSRSVRTKVLDFACAIEVFQTAALVHDDLIDDSDLRRGKPSAHCALTSFAGARSIGAGWAHAGRHARHGMHAHHGGRQHRYGRTSTLGGGLSFDAT